MTGAAVNALLLADGRLPAGGHAHSGGIETAVSVGAVAGIESLASFLRGRLSSTGLTAAALAAASCAQDADWRRLDEEADTRTPSPANRRASRRQGKGLLRTARELWPGRLDRLAELIPHGPHHPVALGAASFAAGLTPLDAARGAAFNAISGPASAAVRLLGVDPVAAHRVLADLSGQVEQVACEAELAAGSDPELFPCPGSVLLDIYAERHAASEVKLFAS